MKFSERMGITSPKTEIQVNSIDKPLENKLWNCLYHFLEINYDYEFYFEIWSNYLGYLIERLPKNILHGDINFVDYMNALSLAYSKMTWYDKYNFIEYIINLSKKDFRRITFIERLNKILILENSGYRVVNDIIIQITNESEITEIESAIKNTDKFQTVNIHLDTSLKHLSNREKPDYRNSIKESISAVESLCKILVKDDKATLGKALAILEKQHQLHPTLKSAFSSLYGYTSAAGGFRHGLMDNDIEATFDDAKYILVICSAFINYVKAKYI